MNKILVLFAFAISLQAGEVEAFLGYAPPSPPHLFANVRTENLVQVGGSYSVKLKGPVDYSVAASFLEVPGSKVYNFGVTPIGIRLNFFSRHKVHPYLLTDEGIIASTSPIPYKHRDATGLNFLVDFGAGVKIGSRVRVAYEILHVSNAGTTNFNPGLECHVIRVGVRLWGVER